MVSLIKNKKQYYVEYEYLWGWTVYELQRGEDVELHLANSYDEAVEYIDRRATA